MRHSDDFAHQRALIENALSRYAWAYDMDVLDQIGGCFANDAEVLFSNGLQVGRSAVVTELQRRRSIYRPLGQVPWHLITNIYLRDDSSGTTAVTSWWSFGAKMADKPLTLSSFGWYDDQFILEEGEWRIRKRRILAVGQT